MVLDEVGQVNHIPHYAPPGHLPSPSESTRTLPHPPHRVDPTELPDEVVAIRIPRQVGCLFSDGLAGRAAGAAGALPVRSENGNNSVITPDPSSIWTKYKTGVFYTNRSPTQHSPPAVPGLQTHGPVAPTGLSGTINQLLALLSSLALRSESLGTENAPRSSPGALSPTAFTHIARVWRPRAHENPLRPEPGMNVKI